MQIRKAQVSDLEAINSIINWHSENGYSTFLMPTSLKEREDWFKKFDSPIHIAIVAENEGRVVGFASSFPYRGGGVFKDTIETSIYLSPEATGRGLGSRLYKELFDQIQGKGVHRVVVGVAIPNEASVALHRKFGFEDIGVFDEYAFYKGEYRSSLWMQKKMN